MASKTIKYGLVGVLAAFRVVTPEEWARFPHVTPKMTEAESQQQSSSMEDTEETKEEYDSENDGELFLYQLSRALEGDKEIIPKINFRRKHPQLGNKISNHELRIRKMENTIFSLKTILKPYIMAGLKRELLDVFDNMKEEIFEDL